MARWVVGADSGLPVNDTASWDGSAAEASIWEYAGFNGDRPNPSTAKRGFLVFNAEEPLLKGSYKLPFARYSNGRLEAVAAGLRAAASRLPQADIGGEAQGRARAVLDHYFARMRGGKEAASDGPMLIQKSFETEHQKIAPEAGDLDAVRAFALRDVAPEELFLGKVRLCNDQYDRTHERFPLAYLQRFAETLPGKSLMAGHDYRQLPLGKFYAASVTKDRDGSHWLEARYYADAEDSRTVRGLELGIYHYTSIGFASGARTCDLCGKNYDRKGKEGCTHKAGLDYEGQRCRLTYDPAEAHLAEAHEGSLVYLGAQYGAATAKGAGLWLPPGDPDALLGETQKGPETVTEREEGLQRELDALRPLAEDGKKYRERLVKQILDRARPLGKVATYERILSRLKDAPAEDLEAMETDVMAEFDEKFPPAPTAETKGAPDEETRSKVGGFDPTRRRW